MRLFLALAAALPLLAAACSSTPPGAPPSASSAASSANPNAGLLTGTRLKAQLAPASWFPSGYQADPSGAVDTGGSYQQPSPLPGAPHCARLDGTSWVLQAGVGAVSFAQNDYINHSTSSEYAQEIDVYQGTGAQDVMKGLRKLSRKCASFRDSQTSSTVTVRLSNSPHLGDDALTLTLTDPRWLGGTTLEAVRIRNAVITVLCSASTGTGKAQATKLAALITRNLARKI